MRRNRRGVGGGHEFGGAGEDSFVAVVVTKLTGALLFILLLTMVIMALLPKAIDLPAPASPGESPGDLSEGASLEITTPADLPEAIVGRPYTLALAAQGGQGPLNWAIDGTLPDGLNFDPPTGQIRGVARKGTPEPLILVLRVRDGDRSARCEARLIVFESDRPLGLPSKWVPRLPPVPWRSWLDQGFGFLVLVLIHLVGMNTVANLENWSLARADEPEAEQSTQRRFTVYRWIVRLATLSALAGLVVWVTR